MFGSRKIWVQKTFADQTKFGATKKFISLKKMCPRNIVSNKFRVQDIVDC